MVHNSSDYHSIMVIMVIVSWYYGDLIIHNSSDHHNIIVV
jgi:hypothetical protein